MYTDNHRANGDMHRYPKQGRRLMSVNGRQGSVLVIVVVFCMVIFALGASIIGITISDYRMGKAYQDGVKAYYLAEAGAERAIHAISRMGTIDPQTLLTKEWSMDEEDSAALGTGASDNFSAKVASVILVDTIYSEEQGPEASVYIYRIMLTADGTVSTMRERLEVVLEVLDFADHEKHNEVTAIFWRKIP
jgi:hypothetical protein